MRVASLWSGGKDSCFACYKAITSGYDIAILINFTGSTPYTSLSHGLPAGFILAQAKSTGIPVIQKEMPQGTYRDEFKKLIAELKETEKIEGIIFGDIYLQEHKDWIDKVCEELKVKAILPLWGKDTTELVLEIVNAGFKARIVATDAEIMGEKWLDKDVDRLFLKGLDPWIDPCGEKGEFHTFVYEGPIFKKPIKFSVGQKILRGRHWFLELKMEC